MRKRKINITLRWFTANDKHRMVFSKLQGQEATMMSSGASEIVVKDAEGKDMIFSKIEELIASEEYISIILNIGRKEYIMTCVGKRIKLSGHRPVGETLYKGDVLRILVAIKKQLWFLE